MSTSSHKANLARIRENQRRSRARRREYLQELEQRLRLCELQGVEASAEVQLAARRVAGENKQLRELLNKCGIGDEHIEQYLQTGIAPFAENAHAPSYSTGNPGSAVQSLQHLITPRRPTCLDNTAVFQVPSPISREGSSTLSGPTSVSSPWESSQPPAYSFAQQPQQLADVPPMPVTQPMQPSYTLPLAPNSMTPRTEIITSHPSNHLMEHVHQGGYEHQFIPANHDPTVDDKGTMHDYTNQYIPNNDPGCFG